MCGDLGLAFNVSYLELRGKSGRTVVSRSARGEEAAGQSGRRRSPGGPAAVRVGVAPQPAGRRTSRKTTTGVRLSAEELDRVITWIDLNAPYYPTYLSNYPNNLFGRSPLDDAQLARLAALTGVPVNVESGA